MTSRSLTVTTGRRALPVRIEADGIARIGDRAYRIEPLSPGVYRVSDDRAHWIVAVAGPRDARWISVNGLVAEVDVSSGADRSVRRRAAAGDLGAPMPATVIRVAVAPGTAVDAGAVLIVLEAMKMELAIRAPRDGVVGAVHCRVGELVQPGVPLLEFA